MAEHTPNFSLPYPKGSDRVAVHSDIEALALKTDAQINGELQEQATRIDTAESTVADLNETVTTQGTELTNVQTSVTDQGSRLSQHDDTLSRHDQKLEPVERGSDKDFRIRDTQGRVALGVLANGDAQIGATIFRENEPGVRYMDRAGRVAFEITGHGQTRIYDSSDAPPTSTVTTVHVFIAAGQSNMSGRGLPVEGPQPPRIMQFGANRRVIEQAPLRLDMVDSPSGTSPATFFAHHYLATQPEHVGVLLVPAARGGTMFRGTPEEPSTTWTWTKGAAPSPEYALYERSVQQTLDAIEAAKAQGHHVILKGVLWHQGEGNGGMATETYAARLDALIEDYRTDLDHPTLPFMVGQQSPEGFIANPSKLTVDAAHQDTPYRTPFTGFAPSTWDGHNEGDTTHFSTVGTSHLGDTYMTAYLQAMGNTPLRAGVPTKQDTDWIDLTEEITGHISGTVLIRRTNDTVRIVFNKLVVEQTGTSTLTRLSNGFRPFWDTRQSWWVPNSTKDGGTVNINESGYLIGYSLGGDSTEMTARIEYGTDQEFPQVTQ